MVSKHRVHAEFKRKALNASRAWKRHELRAGACFQALAAPANATEQLSACALPVALPKEEGLELLRLHVHPRLEGDLHFDRATERLGRGILSEPVACSQHGGRSR